ncbi:MAG: SEC-C metal-binding domain-containing protein [Anaeromyxobacteraceae bacterium]
MDSTLDAFARAVSAGRRAELARVLAKLPPFLDGRILPALVHVLEENPHAGVPLVRDHGDPRGGAHLSLSFDRVALGEPLFCPGHRAWMLQSIAEAMKALGTQPSASQARELARALYDAIGDPCYEAERGRRLIAAAPPASTGRGPGRNAPCPCGSGKKFKRCCG